MPNAWIKERKKEYYYRKAKAQNFRSRASFKLLQAVKKYQFIKEGNVVVDLGAAPGGWTQAALQIAQETGFVLAVDKKQIKPFEVTNLLTIKGDITQPEVIETIKELLPKPADVIISDISPNISGIWELDHARQIDLANHSLSIAKSILKSGGNFFVKVFQGKSSNKFIQQTRKHFHFVKVVKPKASRSKSAEIYVLGMKFKKLRLTSKKPKTILLKEKRIGSLE